MKYTREMEDEEVEALEKRGYNRANLEIAYRQMRALERIAELLDDAFMSGLSDIIRHEGNNRR